MKKKLGSLSIHSPTTMNTSFNLDIITSENILNIRKDPRFLTIEEYKQYYNSEMNSLAEKRKQYVAESDAQKEFEENKEENRYNNVVPMIHTQPSIDHYFNGNVVTLGKFRFLVTQAPIFIGDFYKVIFNFGAQQIVELTKFAEEDQPKADRYVPLGDDEDEIFREKCVEAQYASYALQKEEEENPNGRVFVSKSEVDEERTRKPQEFPWYEKRMHFDDDGVDVETTIFEKYHDEFCRFELTLHNVSKEYVIEELQKDLKVDYFYYGSWGDFSISTEEEIFQLCEKEISLLNLKEVDYRIVLHCSAGIGRSASYGICLYIYYCFFSGDLVQGIDGWERLPISIFEAVESMRVGRHPMCVNTEDQFVFLFKFAIYCEQEFDKK